MLPVTVHNMSTSGQSGLLAALFSVTQVGEHLGSVVVDHDEQRE